MDDLLIREKLKKWLPESAINQAIHSIRMNSGKRIEKIRLLEKAEKKLNELDRVLNQIEREFPGVYERLDDVPRLMRLSRTQFKLGEEESLKDTMKLLSTSIGLRIGSYKNSPKANEIRRTETGDTQFFVTNNAKDDYSLIRELERIWQNHSNSSITLSDDNPFMIFLSICLNQGAEDKSHNARKLYERCRTKADYWGQSRDEVEASTDKIREKKSKSVPDS